MDSGADFRDRCLQLFGGDPVAYAENYFAAFTDYILKRKPDIVGHFDLITKYEESSPCGMLCDPAYLQVAKKYITEAAKSGSIFEVNTGAIARGLRTTPYPSEDLLYQLKKLDAKVILSSDSHSVQNLDCGFEQVRAQLRHIGFRHSYVLTGGEFVKVPL